MSKHRYIKNYFNKRQSDLDLYHFRQCLTFLYLKNNLLIFRVLWNLTYIFYIAFIWFIKFQREIERAWFYKSASTNHIMVRICNINIIENSCLFLSRIGPLIALCILNLQWNSVVILWWRSKPFNYFFFRIVSSYRDINFFLHFKSLKRKLNILTWAIGVREFRELNYNHFGNGTVLREISRTTLVQ